jgi:hypothetical protein
MNALTPYLNRLLNKKYGYIPKKKKPAGSPGAALPAQTAAFPAKGASK